MSRLEGHCLDLRIKTLASSKGLHHHLGGCLSCIEILVAVFDVAETAGSQARDFVVLSKGHAAIPYYHLLEELGLVKAEDLRDLNQLGGILLGHPCSVTAPRGVDFSTGSLGMGLSYGVGLAYALRLRRDLRKVFVIVGDGELQEGVVWEALLFLAQHRLDNICIVVDKNGLQTDGRTIDIVNIDRALDALPSLGLTVHRCDGHDVHALRAAVTPPWSGPTVVIADTIKGCGVSFMENRVEWHSGVISDADLERAMAELSASKAMLASSL